MMNKVVLPPRRRRATTRRATAVPCPAAAAGQERLHALDALRGFAMLLGVVLHAAISYMPCRMPNLLWAVHDRAVSPALDWLFWWIHGFRLPLFFLIAGFFSVLLYESRGGEEFLRNRVRRILLPLAAACAVLLPVTFLIWSCGWLISGQCSPGQVLRIKFPHPIQADLYGLAHLWFLEHLFLLCLAYWAVQRCRQRGYGFALPGLEKLASLIRLFASPPKPLWLATASAVLVWLDPNVVLGFHNTFLPEPLRLAYYGVFFLAGTWLYAERSRLADVARRGPLYLLLSLPVLLSLGWLLRGELSGSLTMVQRLALAAATASFAWLTVFGLLGVFLRWLNRPSAAVRYLSDASYWIYLVHLPVVGLVQVLLYPLPWPALVKFIASIAVALAVGLVSYRDLVRQTFLGRWLNGSRPSLGSTSGWRLLPYGALACGLVTAGGYGAWHVRSLLLDGNLHVVVAGQVYRSAQPSTERFQQLIERLQLRSVVNLQGGDPQVPLFAYQRNICRKRGLTFFAVDLPEDGLPEHGELIDLVEAIDAAPRPVLLHGRHGIARSGLAAAVVELLDGRAPERALEQFGSQYFGFDRTVHSSARVIRAYERWLVGNQFQHSGESFRYWARNHYCQSDVFLGL